MGSRWNPLLPEITTPVYRFRIFGELHGQTTETTFYYSTTNQLTSEASVNDMGTVFELSFFPSYQGAITVDWSGNRIITDRFDDPTVAPYEIDISAEKGIIAGTSCPSFLSMRLRRLTTWGGARGRGTLRIPGVSEASAEGNQLIEPQGVKLMDLASQCLVELTSQNPDAGPWVQFLAVREATEDLVPQLIVRGTKITKALAQGTLGTSRSRMPRRTV